MLAAAFFHPENLWCFQLTILRKDKFFDCYTIEELVEDQFLFLGIPQSCLTSEDAKVFIERCGMVFSGMLRAYCRSRQRMTRKIRPLLRDLNTLLVEVSSCRCFVTC